MLLDKQMELSEYKAIKTRYEDRIRTLESELQSTTQRPSDYKKYLDFGFNILQQAEQMYTTGPPYFKNNWRVRCTTKISFLTKINIEHRPIVMHLL